MTTNLPTQPMSILQLSSREEDAARVLGDIKNLVDDVRMDLSAIESSVAAVHISTGRAISIPEEMLRLGNTLGSIRILLILNLIALVTLCLK